MNAEEIYAIEQAIKTSAAPAEIVAAFNRKQIPFGFKCKIRYFMGMKANLPIGVDP